jgi:hypothetical protein
VPSNYLACENFSARSTVTLAAYRQTGRMLPAICQFLKVRNEGLSLKSRPVSAEDACAMTTYHDDVRKAIQAVRDSRGTPMHAEALRLLAVLLRAIVTVK